MFRFTITSTASLKNKVKTYSGLTFVTILIIFGFTYLYFSTRTGVHTFDALSYTKDVETKPIIELYHPHHLLYGIVGRGAFEIAKTFGYTGRADIPIQFLNALAGAVGIILLWRFGVTLTGRRWLPLSVALLVGVCFAYWLYATEVEVYTFAALFISLSLWILAILHDKPTGRGALLLGAAGVGAVMFHQTNIMFALPVSLFLLTRSRRLILPYGITLGLGIALPYLLVGWFSGFRDPDAYYRWLTDYAQSGNWGSYLSFAHLPAVRDGLRHTISLDANLAWAFYGLAILSFGLGLRSLWQTGRAWLVFLLAWLILYGAFFWWWEPWNIEFWIALLPLWAALMMIGFMKSPHPKPLPVNEEGLTSFLLPPSCLRGGGQGEGLKAALSALALVLALLLFRSHNDPIRAAADPRSDYYQQITRTLQPYLISTDLVVTRGNILDLYLPFYAEHPASGAISLRELSFGGGDPLQALIARLTPAYQRGQIIYLDQIVLDEARDGQRNPFGLSVAEIEALKTQFPITPNVSFNGQNVFYSIGVRASPEASTWSFDDQLEGWLSFGAENPHFEAGAWCINGGGDPWLESPPLHLEAAQHSTLKVEIALQGEAKYGQIFWRRADEGLDEARSIRFPLEGGRHIYTLDLAGRDGWQDTIVFLRLDPIPENLAVTACVYGLEFSR